VSDADGVGARVADLMGRAREDLARHVAMPSVHGGTAEQVTACRSAGEEVLRLVREVGVANAELVATDDGSAAVVGDVRGPEGAPTVLLYSHYDVQPPGDPAGWTGSPWERVERDGRWFGRGAADCKGNLVMLLTALRAIPRPWPVGIRIVCEGSEEASTGGLTRLVEARPELFAADVMLVADTGNVELGRPTATVSLRGTGSVRVTVSTLEGPVHSGMFGGAAPDALAALVSMLATLRDAEGRTTIRGLDATGHWEGAAYDADRFREDAGVLAGVDVIGGGSISDTLWARPVANVLALDAPRIADATAAVVPTASALVNLRVPPPVDAVHAQRLLVRHLHDVAPWNARVEVTPLTLGQPFAGRTDGPGFAALSKAMEQAFGQPLTTAGQGGAIPLCNALQSAHPAAEIVLMGVEEPACRIHSPGESVDPAELERTAFGVTLMLLALGEG
jgi:acetylornithine deacetylase/succinyl-diaminopimelate desuccinylase-like protein